MPMPYTAVPDLIITDLGDELILLDPSRGEMFSLPESGRLVWPLLPRGEQPAAAALAAAYGLEPERAAADVAALVADLLRAGLIVERAADEDDDVAR
jgi:hypothetical protein